MIENIKKIVVIFVLIVAFLGLGIYLYKDYNSDKEIPTRAKFVQNINFSIWGEFYQS